MPEAKVLKKTAKTLGTKGKDPKPGSVFWQAYHLGNEQSKHSYGHSQNLNVIKRIRCTCSSRIVTLSALAAGRHLMQSLKRCHCCEPLFVYGVKKETNRKVAEMVVEWSLCLLWFWEQWRSKLFINWIPQIFQTCISTCPRQWCWKHKIQSIFSFTTKQHFLITFLQNTDSDYLTLRRSSTVCTLLPLCAQFLENYKPIFSTLRSTGSLAGPAWHMQVEEDNTHLRLRKSNVRFLTASAGWEPGWRGKKRKMKSKNWKALSYSWPCYSDICYLYLPSSLEEAVSWQRGASLLPHLSTKQSQLNTASNACGTWLVCWAGLRLLAGHSDFPSLPVRTS